MRQTKRSTLFMMTALLAVKAAPLMADDVSDRLHESATVLKEVMSADDKSIPRSLLSEAHCVVVVPGMKKAGFILSAKYGKGFVTCRNTPAGWGAPGAVRIEGGGVGFQIGASETDVILLVMNKRGMDKLLESKFTLGGDVSVAAGPVGRSSEAQTDAKMTAKILSYSRSRGVFAGVSLEGSTLREDLDENRAL
ncbi:MAG: hypothetical protein JWO80_5677, partial [Bryobacterales bacterium]|nr:hypothetical protein [Bryobacterales bacterium]